MGRLFWKFFFFILLAQVSAIAGVGGTLWFKHQNEQRFRDEQRAPGEQQWRGPPPRDFGPDAKPGMPGFGKPPHPGMPGAGPRGPKGPPGGFHAFIPLMCALVASLVFAALLAWYFAKPIRHLRRTFGLLAQGKLQARVGPDMGRRRDELADLGHDVDAMAEQLATLVQSQRQLLHDVSHEMRSPLARMQAAIGLARQQPDKTEAALARVEQESTRMDKLIGQLLTLARVESGVAGATEAIVVAELLDEVLANARFEAEAQGLTLEVRGKAEASLNGRFELLYSALENVLRNALKHSPPGGRVLVVVQTESSAGKGAMPDRLRIAVIDQGPGVPKEELAAIFEPFYRSAHAGDAPKGYGLGLTIARRVVQAHGGEISAHNQSGAGLRVEIVLPLAA